jgi:hypothetical protein
MSVQVEVPLDRKIHHLLDPIGFRRLSVNVKFADAAIVPACVLALDQLENRRIVEPGLHVVAHAIGPDERHHFELRPFRIHELMRALVRPAGGDDAADAVTSKNLAHLLERIERSRLLVVVEVGVEDFQPLLRADFV